VIFSASLGFDLIWIEFDNRLNLLAAQA